jgi:NADH-quinone oxidoreductase subunit L
VHLHDAPPAMAVALIVLAIGSAVAGYVGIPHALGGHNNFGLFLEPAFEAPVSLSSLSIADCAPVAPKPAGNEAGGGGGDPGNLASLTVGDCAPGSDVAKASLETGGAAQPPADETEHAETAANEARRNQVELGLMAVSSVVALLGIAFATWLWLKRPDIPAALATRFGGLHRLLLNKYYVDEVYDATVVQPIKIVSEEGLWRGMDARVVDGAVNGTGQLVAGSSAILRLFQNGSVKAYAASTLVGVVAILAYYIWR